MVITENVDGTLKKIKPQKINAFTGAEFSEKHIKRSGEKEDKFLLTFAQNDLFV